MVRQLGHHAAHALIALVAIVLALAAPARADDHLIVGTKPSPPFSIKNADGTWSGISIELWQRVANDLHVTFELKEYDLPGLLAAVQHHEVAIAVAATTITAEREQLMDFSHPIYATGLSIAIKPGKSGGLFSVLRNLISWDLAKLLGGMFALLVPIGVLVWWFERRKNAAQFAEHPVRGVADGVWWSAVTMTTVGYGDKSPVTLPGRLLGLLWMFIALVLVSFFTASITSTLTVDRLESSIKGPDDLPRVKVATVAGSTSASYLDRHHITYRAVPTVSDGLHAVAAGDVDAMVYDAPIMEYLAKTELGGQVEVLPNVFEHQAYGFALPDGSALREPLNRALLQELGSEPYAALLERYLGKP